MKSSFCIDLQRFMLIPTKFPLSQGKRERRKRREKGKGGRKKGKASPKIIGRGYGLASAMV